MKKLLLLSALSLSITNITAQNSALINRVLEYRPAPGQFMNTVTSAYLADFNADNVLEKANEMLVKPKVGSVLTLGSWGGYIVVGFDHSIANKPGEYDFKVYGNAFTNGAEPGIVMVSCDTNKNGLADDEWYELAGSEFGKDTETRNYEVTYHRPETDDDNVKWTDNKGNTGFVSKNSFHKQAYYPKWIEEDSYTFKGVRLADNYELKGSTYILNAYPWGYADNVSNLDDASNFNIEWAIDSEGNKVNLKSIDFVKVYTGVLQQCGNIGETSTEFGNVEDLHPDYSALAIKPVNENKDIEHITSHNGLLNIYAANNTHITIFNMTGKAILAHGLKAGNNTLNIESFPKGIYIAKTENCTLRFVK